jgi:hypothetical protein
LGVIPWLAISTSSRIARAGRFACLLREPWTSTPLRLTTSELQLFLEGSALVGRVPLSPAPFVMTATLPMENSLGTRARA